MIKYNLKRLCLVIAGMIMSVAYALACEHTSMEIKADSNGKLYGYCSVCKSSNINLAKWTQTTDFGLSMVDPYLNMEADLCDIGNVSTYINCTNTISKLWIIKDSSKEALVYEDMSSSPVSALEVTLPQTESTTDVTLVADVIKTEINESTNESEENHYTAVMHFTYKPFHSIKGLTISEMPNADSIGVKDPYNQIKWYIENPDDEDIMTSDQFVIYRSKTSDFDQYSSVGSVNLTDIVRRDTLSNGTVIGWLEFTDDSGEQQYNTETDDTTTVYASGSEALTESGESQCLAEEYP